MKKLSVGLSIALTGIVALYAGTCLYKTKSLNRELEPLAKEFETIAMQGPKDTSNFSYDGKLTEIINERDAFVKSCGKGCYPGKWIVKPSGRELVAYTADASVTNPFIKIPKYQGK